MKIITSTENPLIKRLRRLHEERGRKQFNQCLVEGIRACQTFVAGLPQNIDALLITEDMRDEAAALFPGETMTIVSQAVMKKISTAKTPSGVVGVFNLPVPPGPEQMSAGIVLARVSDPGNAGTLVRSAIAFGKKTIVFVESVHAWHPKVIQASAGTIAHVTVFELSWDELIACKRNVQLSALVVHGGTVPDAKNLSNSLLVIGNEAHGIPEAWQRTCDSLVTLPMADQVESLNAAVAGSIALYLSSLN